MRRPQRDNAASPVSEMAIVDAFTKLIFGDEDFSEAEYAIIDALRSVNADVSRDSYRDMGEYLRGLGVREMIQLVSQVHGRIAEPGDAPAPPPGQSAPGIESRPGDRTRGAH